MDNEIVQVEQARGLSVDVFSNPESFQKIYDIGKMFASSSLVPQSYQGKPMDCTIAVDMANRMGVSPMMVMQNLYVVRGKLNVVPIVSIGTKSLVFQTDTKHTVWTKMAFEREYTQRLGINCVLIDGGNKLAAIIDG